MIKIYRTKYTHDIKQNGDEWKRTTTEERVFVGEIKREDLDLKPDTIENDRYTVNTENSVTYVMLWEVEEVTTDARKFYDLYKSKERDNKNNCERVDKLEEDYKKLRDSQMELLGRVYRQIGMNTDNINNNPKRKQGLWINNLWQLAIEVNHEKAMLAGERSAESRKHFQTAIDMAEIHKAIMGSIPNKWEYGSQWKSTYREKPIKPF